MSSTAKERAGDVCNYKEDEQHITCTDDMKNLQITCTEITCAEEVEEVDACANCGKGGKEASMNACNKCDLVVYCNVHPVKRSISQSIKRSVRNGPLKFRLLCYMIVIYSSSNNLLKTKIVPFVCCLCHHWIRDQSTKCAVEKRYVVGVFMQ